MKSYITAASVLGLAVIGLSPMVLRAQEANIHADSRAFVAQESAPVCPGPADGESARCHAHVVLDSKGSPSASTAPAGYSPAQFHSAYNLPAAAPVTQVIAIVDAYDDPNIYNDLTKYSKTFGLPVLPQCSGPVASASAPCFQKVNQLGASSPLPTTSASWSLEISLDVEVAHAVCSNCNILLVEANSNSYADLMAAEDRAVALGATEISNSFGSSESSGETSRDSHFNHTGIAITVSSGDSGYGAQYPASSPYVTAVGGTSLILNGDNSYNSESAWSGGGSGCSAYESKPSFQTDPGCANRTAADVSADADPSTGAAIYDSVRYQGRSGWFKVGGTSLATPLVAGVYALAGGVPSGVYGNSLPYAASANLHDILTGSNGSCGGSYLCTAGVGYDGPTGLGTPQGSAAF